MGPIYRKIVDLCERFGINLGEQKDIKESLAQSRNDVNEELYDNHQPNGPHQINKQVFVEKLDITSPPNIINDTFDNNTTNDTHQTNEQAFVEKPDIISDPDVANNDKVDVIPYTIPPIELLDIGSSTDNIVHMRDVIDTDDFRNSKSNTTIAIGKDINGKVIIADIAQMPHLLIAGATGSGKSVFINSLITSIVYKADPNEVKLIMIDPKMVELNIYNGIPHLLIPVVTDCVRAVGSLRWAEHEMTRRYKLFAENNVRNLSGYNELAEISGDHKLEQIIIIVDGLIDFFISNHADIEDTVCRLTQSARAAGIYLVLSTQCASGDIISKFIKKINIPSRISFAVARQSDSRIILGVSGAEKLQGNGDMLFMPVGGGTPMRIQGAFVSDAETEGIVEYVKQNFSGKYDENIMKHIERRTYNRDDNGESDEMLSAAIQVVVEAGYASASLIQRQLKIGYARSGRLIDQLEERGIIGPHEGSKPRSVLISCSEYMEMQVRSENQ